DRAHVQLALTGVVFGNVGQPQLVDCLGSEAAFGEVVTHWRAGLLAVFPGSFDRVREQLLLRAQSPHTALLHLQTRGVEFIADDPAPELAERPYARPRRHRSDGPRPSPELRTDQRSLLT